MLDPATQKIIGREMRKRHAERPKGAIPDRIWRLLLALERAASTSESKRAS